MGEMKVNFKVGSLTGAPSAGFEPFMGTSLSKSIYVGTRKMVNYA